ncbi:MAG: sensor histidine kinase [Candidatus Promineifilaceae bacterium]
MRTDLDSDQEHIVVLFRDNGKGMNPAELNRIFEPFYTTKSPGRGTGLGLATTHRIIEQHGGQIEVTSAMDEGTTFVIHLPLAHEQDRVDQAATV